MRKRPTRFVFFPFFLLAAAVVTYVVFWLWNNVLVEVVPVRAVTYWQALGLLLLSRILFGGFHFRRAGEWSGRGYQWREKWRSMSDEERSRFRDEWRRRAGHKFRSNPDE